MWLPSKSFNEVIIPHETTYTETWADWVVNATNEGINSLEVDWNKTPRVKMNKDERLAYQQSKSQ
jgi:hypothetical protein